MGKASKSKNKTQYVSTGRHSNTNKGILNSIRRDYMSSPDRILNQQKALYKGKNIVLTIENPNKNETNKKYIKYKIDGKAFIAALKNRKRVKEVEEE